MELQEAYATVRADRKKRQDGFNSDVKAAAERWGIVLTEQGQIIKDPEFPEPQEVA